MNSEDRELIDRFTNLTPQQKQKALEQGRMLLRQQQRQELLNRLLPAFIRTRRPHLPGAIHWGMRILFLASALLIIFPTRPSSMPIALGGSAAINVLFYLGTGPLNRFLRLAGMTFLAAIAFTILGLYINDLDPLLILALNSLGAVTLLAVPAILLSKIRIDLSLLRIYLALQIIATLCLVGNQPGLMLFGLGLTAALAISMTRNLFSSLKLIPT